MIKVKDLEIELRQRRGYRTIVQGVSFELGVSQSLAIVGESGCGKSLTALSVLDLLPKPQLRVRRGHISIDGVDMLSASSKVQNRIRGGQVAMIFQEPMSALNPIHRVGDFLDDVVRRHHPSLTRKERKDRILSVFQKLRIPENRFAAYPHELSGGMRQRVVIALALACGSRYVLADEPTTSLDVTTQAQVLDELKAIQSEFGLGIVLISHDLALVAEYTDHMMVMYCGRIVEYGRSLDVLRDPQHPYTAGLLCSIPHLIGELHDRLPSMKGRVPSHWGFEDKCIFADRCPRVQPRCLNEHPVLDASSGVACFYPCRKEKA